MIFRFFCTISITIILSIGKNWDLLILIQLKSFYKKILNIKEKNETTAPVFRIILTILNFRPEEF